MFKVIIKCWQFLLIWFFYHRCDTIFFYQQSNNEFDHFENLTRRDLHKLSSLKLYCPHRQSRRGAIVSVAALSNKTRWIRRWFACKLGCLEALENYVIQQKFRLIPMKGYRGFYISKLHLVCRIRLFYLFQTSLNYGS